MEVPGGSSFGLEGHPVQVDKRIFADSIHTRQRGLAREVRGINRFGRGLWSI